VSTRAETWLWIAQRGAGLILALAVTLHIATIIYAVHRGLSAAAILGRTQGNVAWFVFYIIFAVAAAIHGGIGLRTIIRETTRWRGASLEAAVAAFVVLAGVAGCRAAAALFA
jgi:fumarate reductase subunit C